MYYMRENMFLPGKVESQIMLVDAEYSMPWSCPIKEIQAMGTVMAMQFRCQAYRVFCLNVSSGLVILLNGLMRVLNEVQRRKAVFSNSGSCKELDDLVEKDMRLKEYGGTQDQATCWWPPVIPGKQNPAYSEDQASDASVCLDSHRINESNKAQLIQTPIRHVGMSRLSTLKEPSSPMMPPKKLEERETDPRFDTPPHIKHYNTAPKLVFQHHDDVQRGKEFIESEPREADEPAQVQVHVDLPIEVNEDKASFQ